MPGLGQYEAHKMNLYSRRGASMDRNKNNSWLNKTQIYNPGPGAY
jgi:hypothetical protein